MEQMTNIQKELKKSCPAYSDRMDKMVFLAQEMIDSKDFFDSMNKIVPTLDAMDAYILGMFTAKMVEYGILRIHKYDQNYEKEQNRD